MKYKDLRDFIHQLEAKGELVRISQPINGECRIKTLCKGSDYSARWRLPYRLRNRFGRSFPPFAIPKNHSMPVLANLFGTPERVAMGMGQESVAALREVGELLAYLKEPEPPKGLKGGLSGFSGVC